MYITRRLSFNQFINVYILKYLNNDFKLTATHKAIQKLLDGKTL